MFSARWLCWPASLEKNPFPHSRQGTGAGRSSRRREAAWDCLTFSGCCWAHGRRVSRQQAGEKSELGLQLWASCQDITGSLWAHPALQHPRYLRGFSSLQAAACSISSPVSSVSDLKFWMLISFSQLLFWKKLRVVFLFCAEVRNKVKRFILTCCFSFGCSE